MEQDISARLDFPQSARKPPRSPRKESPQASTSKPSSLRNHSARHGAGSGMPMDLSAMPIYTLPEAIPSRPSSHQRPTLAGMVTSPRSSSGKDAPSNKVTFPRPPGTAPAATTTSTALPCIRPPPPPPPRSAYGNEVRHMPDPSEDVSWTSTPRPVPQPPLAPPSQQKRASFDEGKEEGTNDKTSGGEGARSARRQSGASSGGGRRGVAIPFASSAVGDEGGGGTGFAGVSDGAHFSSSSNSGVAVPASPFTAVTMNLPSVMERYLQQELSLLEPHDSQGIVSAHREVLRMLGSAFPAFAHIIEKITQAYDSAVMLSHRQQAPSSAANVARALTLPISLSTTTTTASPSAPAAQHHGGSSIIAFGHDGTDLHAACREEANELKSQIQDLTQRLTELRPELVAQQRRGTATVVSNKMKHAVTKFKLENQLEFHLKKIELLEESQKEDLERMLTLIRTAKASECRVRVVEAEVRQQKAELDKMATLQRTLRSLEKEMRELKQTYSHTVPFTSFQSTKTELEKALAAKENESLMMRRLCARRAAELETVVEKYQGLAEKIKEMTSEEQRPLTPRPKWDEIISSAASQSLSDLIYPVAATASEGETATSEVITNGYESTNEIVSMLVNRIRELESIVATYQWYYPLGDYTTMDVVPTSIPITNPFQQQQAGLARTSSNLHSSRSGGFSQQGGGGGGALRLTAPIASQPQQSTALAFGVSPTVPPFLRAWGTVRRTHLTVSNVRQLLVRLFDAHVRSMVDWKDVRTRIAFEIHPFMSDLAKALPSLQSFGATAITSNVAANANARQQRANNNNNPLFGGNPSTKLAAHPTFYAASVNGGPQQPGNSINIPGGAGSAAHLTTPMAPSTVITDPIAFGYSLYLSAQEFAAKCPLCAWFMRCLEGSMPIHIIYGAIDLFKASREHVVQLAELHGRANIKRAALMESLGGVFTTKTLDELEELRVALGDEVSIDVTQIINISHPFAATLIMQEINCGMRMHLGLVSGMVAAAVPQSSLRKGSSAGRKSTDMVGAAAESDGSEADEDLNTPSPNAQDGRRRTLYSTAMSPDDALMISRDDIRRVILDQEPMCPEPLLFSATKLPKGAVQRGHYIPLQVAIDNLTSLCLRRYSEAPRDVVLAASNANGTNSNNANVPRSRTTSNATSTGMGLGLAGVASLSMHLARSRGTTPTPASASATTMGASGALNPALLSSASNAILPPRNSVGTPSALHPIVQGDASGGGAGGAPTSPSQGAATPLLQFVSQQQSQGGGAPRSTSAVSSSLTSLQIPVPSISTSGQH